MDKYINQIRQLLSGQCVVALDTNVLSELEKGTPEWFGGLVKMREGDVKFVIPDLCIGERLNSYERADAKCLEDMKLKWRMMVSQLDKIIWKDFPCVPLRGELYDLVGIKERDKEEPYIRERPLTVDGAKELNRFLCGYENSQFNVKHSRDLIITEFKKVRHDWKCCILRKREKWEGKSVKEMCDEQMAELEAAFEAPIGISNLFELPVRVAAERVHDVRYNPTDDEDVNYPTKKNKTACNDGLDYAILFLVMASVNVCSCDGFLRAQGR